LLVIPQKEHTDLKSTWKDVGHFLILLLQSRQKVSITKTLENSLGQAIYHYIFPQVKQEENCAIRQMQLHLVIQSEAYK